MAYFSDGVIRKGNRTAILLQDLGENLGAGTSMVVYQKVGDEG